MESGGVTGREYGRRRKKGWQRWNPTPEVRVLFEQTYEVFERYAAQRPLTVRQIFYVLVGLGVIGKDKKALASLTDMLTNARRGEWLPWTWLRDSRVDGDLPEPGWADMDSFLAHLQAQAKKFELHPSQGQPVAIELWVEAAGMAPQLAVVANPLGVGVYPGGGFASFTHKAEAAERISRRDRPTVILHVGDMDASGYAIVDCAADDVMALVDRDVEVTFEHVTVLPHHVSEFNLPTAPGNPNDRRGGGMDATVQAEALPPDQLANLVRDAIQAHTDMVTLEEVRARTTNTREAVTAVMGAVLDVVQRVRDEATQAAEEGDDQD